MCLQVCRNMTAPVHFSINLLSGLVVHLAMQTIFTNICEMGSSQKLIEIQHGTVIG